MYRLLSKPLFLVYSYGWYLASLTRSTFSAASTIHHVQRYKKRINHESNSVFVIRNLRIKLGIHCPGACSPGTRCWRYAAHTWGTRRCCNPRHSTSGSPSCVTCSTIQTWRTCNKMAPHSVQYAALLVHYLLHYLSLTNSGSWASNGKLLGKM